MTYTENKNLGIQGFPLADPRGHRAAPVASQPLGKPGLRAAPTGPRPHNTWSTPRITEALQKESPSGTSFSPSSSGKATPHPDCGDPILLADQFIL